MAPAVGSISLRIKRTIVDLPEPLAPTRKTNSPSTISRFTCSSATVSLAYSFVTLSNRIITSPDVARRARYPPQEAARAPRPPPGPQPATQDHNNDGAGYQPLGSPTGIFCTRPERIRRSFLTSTPEISAPKGSSLTG